MGDDSVSDDGDNEILDKVNRWKMLEDEYQSKSEFMKERKSEDHINKLLKKMEIEEQRFISDNYAHLSTPLRVMDIMPYSQVYWNGTVLCEKRPSFPKRGEVSYEQKVKI